MQNLMDIMKQGYQMDWGIVAVPGLFNPLSPNRCVVTLNMVGNNEQVQAILLPVGGIWSFPAIGDTVLVAFPRGNRIPGNAGAFVIPNVNPALPGEMGITHKTPLIKYLYRFMFMFYTIAAMPVEVVSPTMAALQAAMVIWFNSMGAGVVPGVPPVAPMPFPDTLQNSYTINVLP